MDRPNVDLTHEDETLLFDSVSDDFRNMCIVENMGLDSKVWRSPVVPIKDWVLGERYLNLASEIRKPVLDDTCELFKCESTDPLKLFYDEAVFCEGIGCHAKGTKILNHNGTITEVENVQVNDLLMGDDSTPRRVLRLIRGRSKLYKIVPVKGAPFVVNGEHILSLKRTNLGQINSHRSSGGSKDYQAGKILNISVNEYIKQSNKFKCLYKLYRVGVEFEKQRVDIDPYFLGLWLGDGLSNIIGIATKDVEVKDYVYWYAHQEKLFVTINDNKSCPTYIINGKRKVHNHLMDVFRKYNLIFNKHVPSEFKINSRVVRLKVLAGLLDSDGYLGHNCFEFSNKNKVLCDDVLFLCQSLGLSAYIKERTTSCNGKRFKSFRVSISGDVDEIPTRLTRKQATSRRQVKNVLTTGFKVEPLDDGDFYGFELDSNHLYLTGDFTVHHNSGKTFKVAIIVTYFIHLLLSLWNPQKYFKIGKSSKLAIMLMSISERNAKKIIFSEINSKIQECRWFTERPWKTEGARMPDPHCTSELRFANNIFLIPGSSSWRTAVGYNIVTGVIDEAGSYRTTDNGDQCEDIYNALQRRLGSRFESKGMAILAGSPLYVNDFLESRLKDSLDTKSRILGRRRNLWDAKYLDWDGEFFYVDRHQRILLDSKPDDMTNVEKVPMIPFLFKAFKASVTKAFRDYGAVPSPAINPFFENPKIILDKVNRLRKEDPISSVGEFNPTFKCIDLNAFHCVHVDLGITGDACGLTLGHADGVDDEGAVKVYIDVMIRLKGSTEAPIKISRVRDYIYTLSKMGFPISLITMDGFQSVDMLQILEGKGYNVKTLSIDRTPDPYNTLKEVLSNNRLDYYHIPSGNTEYKSASEFFVLEAKCLEEIEGKKIDHPPRGSKDVADSVAGVVYNIVSDTGACGALTATCA